MTLQEKYGQLTVSGCNKLLEEIFNLDDSITIGEMYKFLHSRATTVATEFENECARMNKDVKGKCFRIIFNDKHIMLVKITDIQIVRLFGETDANLTGESITSYEGQLEYKDSLGTDRWLQYFPNQEMTEITHDHFDLIKKSLISITL